MPDTTPILSAEDVNKSFLAHKALNGVSVDFYAGEVHALLGENGAGKSTLIKILTGAYKLDSGVIRINGQAVSPRDTMHAQQLGIGTVYQEVNLLPNMTVAENLFIGRQPGRGGFLDKRSMEKRSREILGRYGLKIDVSAQLDSFSVAIQQIIAIARAVDISGKVLILDEPTASLDHSEVKMLFEVIRSLKNQGLAIVFITHFLDQVFDLCDRVTVLRNGKLVGTRPLAEVSRMDVVTMMLGSALVEVERRDHSHTSDGEVFAAYDNLGLRGSVDPFDLQVRRGEVVGMAGLLGSGRTETARLMFGLDRADSGTMTIGGKQVIFRQPYEAIARGLAFLPEDRKTDGILGDLSVRENIMFALQARRGWSRRYSTREQRDIAEKFVKALDIRTADIELPIKLLSGGNQQKAILARWLATEPELLILDEPTRGIDVGAHAEIIKLIEGLREEGMALVVISSELEEIVTYSTRVVVLRDRKMVGELQGDEISVPSIMATIAAESGTL
jgi:simple sugar transport system ATP-binding protein